MKRRYGLPVPKKCKVTHKTMYKKQSQASRAMMRVISHDPHADMLDLHTYSCEHCGHFHFGHKKWFEMQKIGDNTVSVTMK